MKFNRNIDLKKRIFSVTLSLVMLLALIPNNVVPAHAAPADEPIATLFFASDYQAGEDGAPYDNFSAILDSVNKAGKGDDVDTAVFCGDFSSSGSNYDQNVTSETNTVKNLISEKFGSDVDTVMLQGNHDKFNSNMKETGAYEYEHYIVYVMNTQDANPWSQGSANKKSTVQTAASNLEAYLQGLIANGETRPVFVATHVPLHMSGRTSSLYNSGDNMYSSYFFDVLNEAGKDLNIVFFFGHNHSHGWDTYLGGSAIYLPKGATIAIPDITGVTGKNTDKYTSEKLNFTYMNAGYVGYYSGNTSPADDTLTGTVIDIYGNRMEVNRYDADGLHKLGSVGTYNTTSDNGRYNDTSLIAEELVSAANTASPQEIQRINDVSGAVYMSLKGYSESVDIGSTDTVTASITNAEAVRYEWSTTDDAVAKLLETDKASARVEYNKAGTATISCKVTYKDENGNEGSLTKQYTVTVKAQGATGDNVIYEKVTSTNQITAGGEYLIIYKDQRVVEPVLGVDQQNAGERQGLKTQTTIPDAGEDVIESDSYAAYEWTFEKTGSSWYFNDGAGKYLYVSTSGDCDASMLENSKTALTISQNGDYFRFKYNNGDHVIQCSEKRGLTYGRSSGDTTDFYIYKKTQSSTEPAANIVDADGSPVDEKYMTDSPAAFKAELSNISEVTGYSWSVSDTSIVTVTDSDKAMPTLKFKKKGTVILQLTVTYKDGSGTHTLTVEQEINVEEPRLDIVKGTQVITDVLQRRYEVQPGVKESLTSVYSGTGTVNTITWNSSNENVATITGSGANAELTFNGVTGYTYITVTIEGTDASGKPFTQVSGVTYYVSTDPRSTGTDDYPNYPDTGAIKVDKYAESVDFASTGVAKVALEVDGVSARKALDVVIVLDMSSSMNNSSEPKRYQVMEESLMPLLDSLLGDNADGTPSEHRVAITAFNNYDYYEIDGGNYIDFKEDSENQNGYNYSSSSKRKNPIWSGDNTQTEGALVGSASIDTLKEIVEDNCSSSNCISGTNYDLGLMTAYNILADAREQEHYEREQVVIFMSDGAPFQYNYFRGHSGNGKTGYGVNWTAWLNGDDTNERVKEELDSNEYAQVYINREGKNWWAEAIKSTTDGNKVIDPYDANAEGDNYVKEVDGLGATIYSIGFCLAKDGEITLDQEKATLTHVSGSADRTYFADDGDSLKNVFAQISNELVPAATDTYVKDTVGEAYNIQYADTVTVKGNTIDLTGDKYIGEKPYIEVTTVELDDTRTEEDATRKTVEKVTFETNASGKLTAAYSNLDPGVNIYSDGKISAKYFTLDTETELFDWNIGTVQGTTKYAINYFVSLNGAGAGTREAGSYATNQAAIASYINYLGNACSKEFPVPYMAWQAANITYEFYLVNDKGQPVNEDGAVVTFANRVTYYSDTHTTKLNADNTAQAAVLAQEKLPVGYELFNEDTAYYVNIGSGSNVSDAYVADDHDTQTTFVWRPAGAVYTDSEFEYDEKIYNLRVDGLNDYANTHVAFAVVHTPEFVDRTVTKVWDDEDDKAGKRPDEVTVQLYADGKAVGDAITLDESNKWTYSWENLYKYRYVNGVPTAEPPVEYTIIETPVDNYIPSVTIQGSRFTLTNKYNAGVYSLQVKKENEDNTALQGAGFRLYTDENCLQQAPVYMDAELTQKLIDKTDDQLWTDSAGMIHFYGLSPGTYYIREFRTPTGYTLLEAPLKLEIGEDGEVTVTNDNGTYPVEVDENNQITITVTNRQLNVDIPFTAGTGIFGLLYAAMFLILVATYLMFRYKKRQRTN